MDSMAWGGGPLPSNQPAEANAEVHLKANSLRLNSNVCLQRTEPARVIYQATAAA